ncbi:MAG: DUF692 domain-containing protein, partial [Spirochaetia bacterium]|nr:DUF692 domain-containing protein [Spirochaetia bacterium]
MQKNLSGFGIGLRREHYTHILEKKPVRAEWFEAISENYMDSFGRPLYVLEKVREEFPVALHGVSMSVASADGVSEAYLKRLKSLVSRIDPFIVSDHLCWNHVDNKNHHDLLPFPLTEESLRIVSENVQKAQDILQRKILIENVSAYLSFPESKISEWDFLNELACRTGCGLLLDVNNVYVSAVNLGYDAQTFLDAVPEKHIGQIHLAGFSDMGDFLFDTHSRPVWKEVWDLYESICGKIQNVPVLIEWDEDIPDLSTVEEEALKAKKIRETYAISASN